MRNARQQKCWREIELALVSEPVDRSMVHICVVLHQRLCGRLVLLLRCLHLSPEFLSLPFSHPPAMPFARFSSPHCYSNSEPRFGGLGIFNPTTVCTAAHENSKIVPSLI